jgi:hypothetical protein
MISHILLLILFKRNVWLYNKGNYDLFKQRVGDTDWGSIINNQTDMDISCNLFTKKLMQIAHECIPTVLPLDLMIKYG